MIITTYKSEFKFNQSVFVQTYLIWLVCVTVVTKLDYGFTKQQNTGEVHCHIPNQYSHGSHQDYLKGRTAYCNGYNLYPNCK